MLATDPRAPDRAPPEEVVRAAFHDLHGQRLHGFGLLLTLGDRAATSRLVGEALAAGVDRAGHLRHPERAAAWLRARVVRNAGRVGVARHRVGEGGAALTDLGADPAVVSGLAALDRRERATIIASSIERLDARDVSTIVDRDGRSLERLLHHARARYLAAYDAAADDGPAIDGPLAARLHEIAQRAMG
jgi:DNA-directed RNA polymerase specialized sigma24 family protein